jgi:hypothetical protein
MQNELNFDVSIILYKEDIDNCNHSVIGHVIVVSIDKLAFLIDR